MADTERINTEYAGEKMRRPVTLSKNVRSKKKRIQVTPKDPRIDAQDQKQNEKKEQPEKARRGEPDIEFVVKYKCRGRVSKKPRSNKNNIQEIVLNMDML